jgi:Protein of unknown function (DUF2975)
VSSPSRRPDPLGPIAYITNVVSALLLIGLLAVGVTTATGSGSFLSFGHDAEVCVSASPGQGVGFAFRGGQPNEGVVGVHPGIESHTSEVTTCDPNPGLGLRMLGSVPGALDLSFLIGFLVLTRRLISHARARGLFTEDAARRVGLIGTFVLVGSLFTAVASAISDGMVLNHAKLGEPWGWGFVNVSLPVPTLIAGFGILTVGRVLHIAVRMQHDIDATI